ncbi:MAG: SRPBCC domain-containing protein [Planktotalea sp.]|uniref:SRPBCC domain-containing protein n=1 Tax=Planktotalea sp. TaxID=2029877 RepID=UPI003C78B9F5
MTTDTGAFDFERALPLAPDQLWHVLTDGTMRERWGAPSDEMVLTMTKSDLSVGGIERHVCGPKENPEFEVETRWYRLDAPADAVYTETLEFGGSAVATSLVTYRIAANESGSTLCVHVSVSSFSGPDAASEFKEGWEGGLQNLEALAKELASQ